MILLTAVIIGGIYIEPSIHYCGTDGHKTRLYVGRRSHGPIQTTVRGVMKRTCLRREIW